MLVDQGNQFAKFTKEAIDKLWNTFEGIKINVIDSQF